MSKNSAARGSSRQRLVQAASDLVARDGVYALTLEAVAAAAGVTKGGLIYHFKTKDDLLTALIAQTIELLDQRHRAKSAARGGTQSAIMLAHMDEALNAPKNERLLMANMLAAASAFPHLLGPVREAFIRLYGELSELGPNAGTALVILAALDGLSLLELLDLHQFTKPQRKAMQTTLRKLALTLD